MAALKDNCATKLVSCKVDHRNACSVPLCVDLDGTLIHSDMLVEGILELATSLRLHRALPSLQHRSRAMFKSAIAAAATFDPALLPYNLKLLAYLREQKALGRKLVLVTAADAAVAHLIAAHLGLFDEVMASDGKRNLKGRHKAEALVERFGHRGFAYAGDSRDDLEVWKAAASIIPVNPRKSVAAAARRIGPIEREFIDRGPLLFDLLKAMRPHQWVKNLLVFVPFLVSGHALTADSLATAILAFAAFSATASGIYLLNDLTDLAADRKHPRKRNRPFARGAISLQAGLAAALTLVVAGVALAGMANILPVVVLYALVSVAYSEPV